MVNRWMGRWVDEWMGGWEKRNEEEDWDDERIWVKMEKEDSLMGE